MALNRASGLLPGASSTSERPDSPATITFESRGKEPAKGTSIFLHIAVAPPVEAINTESDIFSTTPNTRMPTFFAEIDFFPHVLQRNLLGGGHHHRTVDLGLL